jgi:hypothetical protein
VARDINGVITLKGIAVTRRAWGDTVEWRGCHWLLRPMAEEAPEPAPSIFTPINKLPIIIIAVVCLQEYILTWLHLLPVGQRDHPAVL